MLKAFGYGIVTLLVVVLLSTAAYLLLKKECSLNNRPTKVGQTLQQNRSDKNSKISNAPEQEPGEGEDAKPSAGFDLSVTGPNKIEGYYYTENADRESGDWGHKFLCETKVGEFSLAVLTLALVVVTGLLWFATARLVKGADEIARKQLRAYIGVKPGGVVRLRGEELLIGHYTLRNVGGIPARNIALFAVTSYFRNGSQKDFRIGTLHQSTTAIVPKAEMTFGTASVTTIPDTTNGVDPEELAEDEEAASGATGFIFVYGRVAYTDDLGTDGWTDFCHRYPCSMLEEGVGSAIDKKYARYHELGGNNAG